MMGRSSNGQPALVSVSSRQCRCAATCWNAGLHIAACESPTRATVVVDAVSPVAHSGCPTSENVRMQPLRQHRLCSAAASASGGSRFDGTALRSADAATAACTCANACCTAASYGVDVSARGGRRRGDGQWCEPAAPWPTGMGTNTSSATPTQTATAVTAPPSARLRGGRPAHGRGESQGVLDEAQCEHGQPAGDEDRCQPAGQPQRVAQQRRCEHQYRPVPQIPRVRHPADRSHRRQCQDAAASREQVRHSPRRSPVPCRARATARRYPDRAWSRPIGCRPAGSGPDLPIPRSRQIVPVVGATGWP